MEYNVAQLLQSPVGETRQFDVDERIGAVDEYELVGPVQGDVRLLRTSRGVFVDARLSATVKLVCGRCLDEVEAPLAVRVREEFIPTIDVNSGLPVNADEDAEAFRIDDHHVLSLDDAFRQYVLLELPIQPLCRPDCAGLCPRCGKNLNEGPCDCPPEPATEALEPLARLLRDLEDQRSGKDEDAE